MISTNTTRSMRPPLSSKPSRPLQERLSAGRSKRSSPPPPSKTPPPPPPGCICLREKSLVLCRCCGWHGHSRVKVDCELHPHIMYLMDLERCPKCKAYPPHITEQML